MIRKSFLLFFFWTCATSLFASKTWFVRVNGGTRYDAVRAPLGQCDGLSDTAYSGRGTNQHCAFNDVRWMYSFNTPEGYGYSQWAMQGGDTLVIRGCSAANAQQHPDNPHCRIGWDRAEGNDNGNFWCAGVGKAWGCSMPPVPSGTAEQHTRILGGCAFGNYSCNPVIEYPYTNNNLTQLFGGFAVGGVLYLSGSQYVDVEGLEITSHNGKCTRVGYPQYPAGCSTNRPVSDFANWGIITTNTTGNILLQDVYIHGMANIAIGGPIGGKVELNRVSLDFNAFAGWNFDNGMKDASTPNGPGSSLVQHYVTMVGNGCLEEYPIQHTQFPALACWDTNTGGFGDAWSGQDSKLDTFTCDHCRLTYNVKDAAMGPHTVIHNLSITDSVFEGNAGQAGKWANDANSTFLYQNDVIIGNCMALQGQIPGARQLFGAGTKLPGAYVTGCRAAGGLFSYFATTGARVHFNQNTIVTYQPTIFQFGCAPAGTHACANTPYYLTNNLILGYSLSGSDWGTPSVYYIDDAGTHVVANNNLEYGVRNGDACGKNGNICVDPLLVNQPSAKNRIGSTALNGFNVRLSDTSPARGRAKPIGVAADFFGRTRPVSPSIGAVEAK